MILKSPNHPHRRFRIFFHEYPLYDPEFIKKYLRDLYVDDTTSGAQTREQAFELYLKSKYRMLDAGFTLRKWHSSDSVLEEQIAKYEKAASGPTRKKLKILGMPWDKTEDKFCMDLPINSQIGNNFVATKRNVLQVIGSIFDPVGVLSPVTVVFKMFFKFYVSANSIGMNHYRKNLKENG